jgi:hypothetical protein
VKPARDADVLKYEALSRRTVHLKVVSGTSRIMTQVMARNGHGSSNMEEFGMKAMESGTDGINPGMNAIDPRDSAARQVAGQAG